MAPFLLLFLLLPLHTLAQQPYINNEQLDCNRNHPASLGYLCSNSPPSCPSFLTFRSSPSYNTPASIASLLSSSPSLIAQANNLSSPFSPLPDDTLLLVPITCSCTHYYQHNASYALQHPLETYFSVANDTYQSLTTCHAMMAQNPYDYRRIYPGLTLNVPLRCACPSPNQTSAGFRFLLTYLIRQGNTYDSIAKEFAGAGADVQAILDANMLTADHLIYFFTPILVPLKTEPTRANTDLVDSPLPPPAIPAAPAAGGGGSGKRVFVGVGIGAAVLVLLLLLGFLVWFFRYRGRKASPFSPPKLVRDSEAAAPQFSGWSVSREGIQSAVETLTMYRFEELEKATGCFAESNRIKGSSAYLGSFKGDNAVVKMMEGDVSREIEALRQINHSHIIRLSGFCLHEGVTYLVYEYAENGSLYEWLHPSKKDSYKHEDSGFIVSDSKRLDWKQRVQIAYDVADALNYLHNFTNPPYIYNNLKSSNVLLDGHMRAKIANFGLARALEGDIDQTAVMTRHVVGTHGYMAPEYIENGLVTPKLDVFALGVVMLELLSGKEPVEGKNVGRKDGGGGGKLLSESIRSVLVGENVRQKLRGFVDPWLGEEYPAEMAYAMARLAMSCVADNISERPDVSEVFLAMSKLLSSLLDWDPSHDTSLTLSD